MSDFPVTRRDFLAASALAAGSLARARADEPVKSTTKPGSKPIGANERITLGFIGLGGMGTGLLNIFKKFDDVAVAAVCDVYEPHVLRAKSATDDKAEAYGDFRKVLDRKDIDAVVVATPDHWHAIPAILACQAEKDVYCEKPLSYRIAEGRVMVDAANKYKRVTQMGNLIHAGENYHRVVEIVQSGVLGKISKTRVWMAGDKRGLGSPADTNPPEGCDYDFWLGPAPKRPFNPNRFTFNWRYFWDYAGGTLGDFCCHIVDPVHWAMGVEYPETVVATGGRYALKDNAETPDTLEVVYHYKKGDTGFDMVWSQTDASSHGFEARGLGIEFQGTEATLVADYGKFELFPEKGVELKLPEPSLPRSPGHHREWLNAIKSRAACSCRFDYGHRLSSIGHLGNIALWTGEKLRWDGEAERVTNHQEANQHLARAVYRAPWTLPRV
ncbi:MAG: Gfo/Idh/MocA family oxidoreductase [Isosphaeraceae bacterium]|nr:Gfo/Idh/MocA family oxidoreductase [Isosphaeraceae bacterium]